MNDNHLQQIFANYINEFERINNPEHREYYKWQIAKRFHNEMDVALTASAEDLPSRLYALKKLTSNVIDSYTQPFHGLVKFSEKEPETVREMFQNLFDESIDLQKRVEGFLAKSHSLRDRYYPDSFLYKDDMHSVTGYLFLYNPDQHYIYKATHALRFADCVEFYDDWGSGDTVKLNVYYRMCDQLVHAIKNNKELMATDASRFEDGWGEDPDTLYLDPEKHILAFDIIYCCSTYGLFHGISFTRPKSKERQLLQERKEKAAQLSEKLEAARNNLRILEEATAYVNSVFKAGEEVSHIRFGKGVVQTNDGMRITVEFPENETRQFGTLISAAKGIITSEEDDYAEKLAVYKAILGSEDKIRSRLIYAEKEFASYAEYLE